MFSKFSNRASLNLLRIVWTVLYYTSISILLDSIWWLNCDKWTIWSCLLWRSLWHWLLTCEEGSVLKLSGLLGIIGMNVMAFHSINAWSWSLLYKLDLMTCQTEVMLSCCHCCQHHTLLTSLKILLQHEAQLIHQHVSVWLASGCISLLPDSKGDCS